MTVPNTFKLLRSHPEESWTSGKDTSTSVLGDQLRILGFGVNVPDIVPHVVIAEDLTLAAELSTYEHSLKVMFARGDFVRDVEYNQIDFSRFHLVCYTSQFVKSAFLQTGYFPDGPVIYPPILIFPQEPGFTRHHQILFAGRADVAYKGLRLLLQALNQIPNAPKLLVAGPFNEADRAYSEAQGIDVQFLGYLKHIDVAMLYASVKATILPGTWNEPFGRPVLESLAAGTPVIATRKGGPLELLQHDFPEMLCEPNAPGIARGIQQCLERPHNRLRYRSYAENFSAPRAAQRLIGAIPWSQHPDISVVKPQP